MMGAKWEHETATPEEKAEREATGRTQGKKGCRVARISMGMWTDNYDYIRTMARATGRTITEYVNIVIQRYRTEHPGIYDRAKALNDELEELGTQAESADI